MREIVDFKPFVPPNEYDVSKASYECMGFTINWDSGEVCEVDPTPVTGSYCFPRIITIMRIA